MSSDKSAKLIVRMHEDAPSVEIFGAPLGWLVCSFQTTSFSSSLLPGKQSNFKAHLSPSLSMTLQATVISLFPNILQGDHL